MPQTFKDLLLNSGLYDPFKCIRRYMCMCACLCGVVFVWSVYGICMWVCRCTYLCIFLQSTHQDLGCLLLWLPYCLQTVSQWTIISLFQLGWLDRKLLGSSCYYSSVLGLHFWIYKACTATFGFLCGCWIFKLMLVNRESALDYRAVSSLSSREQF